VRPFYLEPVPRDPAREAAEEELSKPIYQRHEPSPLERALDWMTDRLNEFLNQVGGSTSGGALGILLLVGVLVVLIGAVLIWFGPLARSRQSAATGVHLEPTATEHEHRRLADAHAAEGRYAEAVRERLRAIVRSLTDRGLLDNRLGRTATEIATEAGRELPSVAADLRQATDLFGAIWYGRRTATADDDATLRAIDAKVAAARPGQGVDAPAFPGTSWVGPGSTP
jgi:hypothetical protein